MQRKRTLSFTQYTAVKVSDKTCRLFEALTDSPIAHSMSRRPLKRPLDHPNDSPLPDAFLDRTGNVLDAFKEPLEKIKGIMNESRWSDIYCGGSPTPTKDRQSNNEFAKGTTTNIGSALRPVALSKLYTPMPIRNKTIFDKGPDFDFDELLNANDHNEQPSESSQILIDDVHSVNDILSLSSEAFNKTYTKAHDSLLLVTDVRPKIGEPLLNKDKTFNYRPTVLDFQMDENQFETFIKSPQSNIKLDAQPCTSKAAGVSERLSSGSDKENLNFQKKAMKDYPELRLDMNDEEFEEWYESEMEAAETELIEGSLERYKAFDKLLDERSETLDKFINFCSEMAERRSKIEQLMGGEKALKEEFLKLKESIAKLK